MSALQLGPGVVNYAVHSCPADQELFQCVHPTCHALVCDEELFVNGNHDFSGNLG